MAVTLTQEKKDNLKARCSHLLERHTLKIREVVKIIGSLCQLSVPSNMDRLIIDSWRTTRRLLWRLAEVTMTVTCACPFQRKMNFAGGLKCSKMHQYNDILVSEPEETVTSDASNIGWGCQFQGNRTGGAWLPAESQFHINYLELKAAFFALQCFQTQIGGKTVGLRIDNTTAMAAINSRGTGRACS